MRGVRGEPGEASRAREPSESGPMGPGTKAAPACAPDWAPACALACAGRGSLPRPRPSTKPTPPGRAAETQKPPPRNTHREGGFVCRRPERPMIVRSRPRAGGPVIRAPSLAPWTAASGTPELRGFYSGGRHPLHRRDELLIRPGTTSAASCPVAQSPEGLEGRANLLERAVHLRSVSPVFRRPRILSRKKFRGPSLPPGTPPGLRNAPPRSRPHTRERATLSMSSVDLYRTILVRSLRATVGYPSIHRSTGSLSSTPCPSSGITLPRPASRATAAWVAE